MGTEKQRADKAPPARGARKPAKKTGGGTSYTGMGLDPMLALSYTERLALGIESDEVPEGPDHITADDMGRHGGFILRSRQITQAHQRHLKKALALVDLWKVARDEIDTLTAEHTLEQLVEIYRRALVAIEEAGMLALAEPQLDTLSTFPRERPIDIALQKLEVLETSLEEAEKTVPEDVGIWEFRGTKLDDTYREKPPGDIADQTKHEGDVTLRLLYEAKQIFRYLGSDFTKAPESAKTVGFSMLMDPTRKGIEGAFLRHVFFAVYAADRPVDPGEEALAVLMEAATIDAAAAEKASSLTPIKRDRLVDDIRYLHAQLLAPEITVDKRLLAAIHMEYAESREKTLKEDPALTVRAIRLRLAWLIATYDKKPHDYAKSIDQMQAVEDARVHLKQHAAGDIEAFTEEAAGAFFTMMAHIPNMAGPAVTIDGKTVISYAEAADWQQNWRKKVALELLFALTIGLGYLANLVVGFGEGLLDWFLEIKEAVEGFVELVKTVAKINWRLTKALFTGDLFDVISELVDDVTDLVAKIPEILEEMVSEFLGNWNHRDPLKQARYRGKIVGYLTAEIIVAAVTAGSSLAARASSKVGRIVAKILGHSKFGTSKGAAKAAARRLGVDDIVDDIGDVSPAHLPDVDVPKPAPPVDVPAKVPDVDVPKQPPDVDVPKQPPDVDVPRKPVDVDVPKKPAVDVAKATPEPEPTKKPTRKQGKEKKPKKKSEGQRLAEELGYPPDPGAGYHWAVMKVDGKRTPYVKLSPRRGGNPRPRIRYNPDTRQFEVVSKRWASYDHSKLGKHDPCFPPETLVKTPSGDRRIVELGPGDEVLSFDFEANAIVTQTISALHRNWTERLATVRAGGAEITSTRMHSFWTEHGRQWMAARALWPGMSLRALDGSCPIVETVSVSDTVTPTYNLEVVRTHTYFVGELGVLVHNGGDDGESIFADREKKPRRIYKVIQKDVVNGKTVETVIYVGKTDRTLKDRFKEHMDEKEGWQKRAAKLRIELEADGNWTQYDTAVWEKHTIAKYKAMNPNLENVGVPISKAKFQKFAELHVPCP